MSTTIVVFGATGYIGEAVSIALRRAGYRVIGVVRNVNKAKKLKQYEVTVVVGDISEPNKVKEYIEQAEVIIDAIGITDQSLVVKIAEITKTKSRKPAFIHTSGIMAHGDSPKAVDETCEPVSRHLSERIQFEKFLVNYKDLRGIVLRPGFVYGGNGGFFADIIFSIKENDDLVIIGRKDRRWTWVHVEDLADAYVRIINGGHVADGEIIDLCGPWSPTYEEILLAAAKAAGWKGKVVYNPDVPKDNHFLQVAEDNCIVNSAKAFNLFRWKDNHLGIVAEIDTYYASWKNSK